MRKFRTEIVTLLLIANSGVVLTTQVWAVPATIALIVAALIFPPKVFSRRRAIVTLALVTAVLLNLAIYSDNLDGHILLAVRILCVSLVAAHIDWGRASTTFVYAMSAIGILSLPHFFLGLLEPELVRASTELTESWGQELRITPLYVFPPYTMTRNQGPYWEPGAFQVFLNLALLVLAIGNQKVRAAKYLAVVLIACVLTTFSTTGYIALGLIGVCLLTSRTTRTTTVPPWVFFALLLLPLGLYRLVTSGVVVNKFAADNASYLRRNGDADAALTLLLERPITGWGYQNNEILSAMFGFADTSNSFLAVGYQFGAVMLVFVTLLAVRSSMLAASDLITRLSLVALFVMFTSTENLIWQPLFLALLLAPSRVREDAKNVPTAGKKSSIVSP